MTEEAIKDAEKELQEDPDTSLTDQQTDKQTTNITDTEEQIKQIIPRDIIKNNNKKQGCIKFLIPPSWGGGVIKPVGEEYKVVERGTEYHGYREEYNMKKGKQIIFPIILKNIGEYQVGEGDENFWEENQK